MLLNFSNGGLKTECEITHNFLYQINSQNKRYRSKENEDEILLKRKKKFKSSPISKFHLSIKSKSNKENQNIKRWIIPFRIAFTN